MIDHNERQPKADGGSGDGPHAAMKSDAAATRKGPSATDHVCGITVPAGHVGRPAEFMGRAYLFCSDRRAASCAQDPWFYASDNVARPTAATPAGVRWACPMHPEILRDAPGTCPICGMALEPVTPGTARGGEPGGLTPRKWLSAVAALALVLIAMGDRIGLPLREWIGRLRAPAVEAALAAPVIPWAAAPFFVRGWQSLRNRSPNMWTLISLGVGAAFAHSLVATFLPDHFPPDDRGVMGVGPYYEAAVVIVALVFVGQVLELRARDRTGDPIQARHDLAPKTARRVVPGGGEYDAPLGNVAVGDLLRLPPGDAVPVDGVVSEGHSSADESMLTGESLPVGKTVGDTVTGGGISRNGGFIMRAGRIGADTVLSQIVEMIARARRSRTPIQGMADRASAIFAPAVVVIAAAMGLFSVSVAVSVAGNSLRLQQLGL